MLRKPAIATALLAVVVAAAGCGGEDEEAAKTSTKPAEKTSKAITFDQLGKVELGTTKRRVLELFGPPIEKEDSKPAGAAVSCYRYYAVDEAGTAIDKTIEFRFCYDKRDRLSLKSTAPPPDAY